MEMMMSNSNGDNNDGALLPLSLPIGFRFQPTDEELLFFYLKRKNLSSPLPPSPILQVDDVFNTNPWDLPGEVRKKRYLFSQRKENAKKCSSNVIPAGCGYWRIIGPDKLVIASCNHNENEQLVDDDDVGMKRSLRFYRGSHPTPWAMDQFCIARSVTCPYLDKNFITQTGDWVLCRVHRIKRRPETGEISTRPRLGLGEPDVVDSMNNDDNNGAFRPPQASSSCSSGTGETSASSDPQDITSHHLNHSP